MKQLYTFFFLLLFIGFPVSLFAGELLPPTATMTGNASVCMGAASPIVTFTGLDGTAPFTFVYKIGSVVQPPITTTSGNSITVPQLTNVAGTFVYHLVSVAEGADPAVLVTVPDVTIIVYAPPTVAFSYNTTPQCSGTSIQFTPTITGTGPYTYEWDFGDSATSSQVNPSHSFNSVGCGTETFHIRLRVTDAHSCTSGWIEHDVDVKQKPDINFEDVNATGASNQFSNCANAAFNPVYSITVGANLSNSSCIASYNITWGDTQTETNVNFPISHTYNQLGAYNMVITAIGTNGCSNSKTYLIKNVSNPSGGINSPGSTQNLCIPTAEIQFTMSNWGKNSPGTVYAIDYGDNSPILNLNQEDLKLTSYYNIADPASSANYPLPYSYTTTSCPGLYTVTLTVTNACGFTVGTISNISTIAKPVANFTAPLVACRTTNVLFTNTTTLGYDSGCDRSTRFIWDFGDPSNSNNIINTGFVATVSNVSHTFSGPGIYTITLTTSNSCGISTKTQQICIEAPITPLFTLSNNVVCINTPITATNNTNITGLCNAANYLWEVTYASGNCGVGPVVIADQTTANANYSFSTPGTYSIKLTMTNSCGSFNVTKTVTVKKPPTVSINTIANLCGASSVTVSPTASITNCGTQTPTYLWHFPGGSPATSTDVAPTVTYNSIGSKNITLDVTNECGTTVSAQQDFSISPAVIASAGNDITKCSSGSVALNAIGSSGSGTGYTYSWLPVAGLSNPNIANPNASPATTTTYTVTVTDSSNCTATDQVAVNVNTVTAGTIDGSQTICSGDNPVAFTIPAAATGAGTLSYQWQDSSDNVSFTDISGAVSAIFDPPILSQTMYYRRITISTLNGVPCTATSTVLTITVNNVAAGSIATDATICTGGDLPAFTVTTAATGSGTITYQWENSNDNVAFNTIPGATSAIFNPPALSQTTYYRRIATSTLNGVPCNAVNNIITVTVIPIPTVDVQPLTQPQICQNAAAQLLTATASGGNGALSYQWYYNSAPSVTGATILSAETGATLNPPTANAGNSYYFCVVSAAGAGCQATSNFSMITVLSAANISQQPAPQTMCFGTTPAPLTVTYQNGSSTGAYQWYSNTTNTTASPTILSGETNATYQPSASVGTTFYFCIITFTQGGCSSITSNIVPVTINALPSAITQTTATCSGTAFSIAPVDSGGNNIPAGTTYSWTNPTGTGFTGGSVQNNQSVISQTLVNTTNAAVTAIYTVTPKSGTCNGTPFTATVTINPMPKIPAQPQTICSGGTFTVTPANNAPAVIVPANTTYSWSAPIITGGITGGTSGSGQLQITDTLVNPTNTVQTATYTVTPVSPLGNCIGADFTVIVAVNPMPVIANTTQAVCSNNSFSITSVNGTDVVPTGTTYTWTAPVINPFGAITGASANAAPQTAISQTLVNNTLADATATYTVTPKSGSCTGNTFTITVTVSPIPSVNMVTSQVLCNGAQTNAIAFSGAIPLTEYNWTNDMPSIGLAASGQGDIAAFNAVNIGNTPVVATITVTPQRNGCPGTPVNFTITVNPAPSVIFSQNDQTICSGTASAAVTLTSATANTTFAWTAAAPVGITGYTASGTATINAQTLINTTSNPLTVIYIATATTVGIPCPGAPVQYSVTVNPVPLIVSNQAAAACSEVALNVTPADGGGNRVPVGTTYSWTTPSGTGFTGGSAQSNQPGISQTLVNITNAPVTAIYTVTPKLGNCSGVPFPVTITINPAPKVPAQTQDICSGGNFTLTPLNNLPATVIPVGTTYSWGAPVVTGNITGGASGTAQTSISGSLSNTTDAMQTATYTVTPVSGGCPGPAFTVVINVNPIPVILTPQAQSICSGAAFTIAPVTNSTDVVPANTTYTWSLPVVNPAGAVTGSTANTTGQSTISQALTNITNANATVTYTVTPKSGNCAGNTFAVVITVSPVPTVDTVNNQIICNGEQTTAVNFTGAVAGTIYNWTNTNATIGLAASGQGSIVAFGAVNNGTSAVQATITVTPQINGCDGTPKTLTITVNPAPATAFSLPDQAICSAASSAAVILTSTTPNTTFSWTTVVPAGVTGVITSGTSTIPAQLLTNTTSNPITVTYTATATTVGIPCPGAATLYTITVNPVPFVVAAQTTAVCSGEAINFTPPNSGGNNIPIGTTYTWSAPSGTGFTGGSAQAVPQLSFNLVLTNTTLVPVTATYTVTPEFNNCTGVPFQLTITVNPKATIGNTAQLICSGGSFSVNPATITGASIPVGTTYSWAIPTVMGEITGGAAGNGQTLVTGTLVNLSNVNQTATYTVTPISPIGNCSGTPFIVVVTVSPALTVTSTVSNYNGFEISTSGANDGFINLTPSGGSGTYTYSWTGPGTFAALTQNVSGLSAGDYYVTISDGLCNDVLLHFLIKEPLPLIIEEVIASHFNLKCFGDTNGVIEVAVTQISIAPFDYVIKLQGGAVVETVTDSNVLNYVFDNLLAGTYDIIVTDANGTVKQLLGIVVTQPANPLSITNVSISDYNNFSITCFDANNADIDITVGGGTPPYTYAWSGPNGFTAATQDISGLVPGNYSVVINDATGLCSTSGDYVITEPLPITISSAVTQYNGFQISCFGANDGNINIAPSGGTGVYTYSWTGPGSYTSVNQNATNLFAGTYNLAVTDSNGCINNSQVFTLTEPQPLAITETHIDILCYGAATGSVNINVSGGNKVEVSPGVFDYLYNWSGPNSFTSTTQNLNNIPAGTYNLIVTDLSGCTKNLQVTLAQPTEIIITATTTAISCYGANDASISLTITGGNAPYQIGWSNLGSGAFQDNLSAGIYTITVTDATNCVKVLSVNIPEAPVFTINPVVQQISCFGANNGSITLNLVGGIAPVSLVWNDNGNTGVQRNNLGPGTYTVTITDGKPCVINRTFVILEPQPLVLSANLTHAFDCNDANSGAINLLVSGGTPPFAYNWSNGAVTEDLSTIPAGNYLITVTDANGCAATEQYVINRQPPLVANVITDTDFDCETHFVKQTFIADVVGGIPPYHLAWSSGTVSGANNEFMETSQEGAVILDVTDNLGCTTNYTFNVEIPVLGEPSWTADSFAYLTYGNYSIVDPIQFTSAATGEYESIAWDFGDGSFSTEVNPIHSYVREGEYIVTQTVTYPFGCVYKMTITILVDKGYALIMPSAFTPNKDVINDNFSPVFKGLKLVRIDIYNTWGEMIYSEEGDTIKGWDGTIKGFEVENGNYYYRVVATTFYGDTIKQEGPFLLIK